jgi:hypothetical protein
MVIVEDIKIPADKQEKLEQALKQVGNSYRARHNAIKRFGGTICCKCDNYATKKLIYDTNVVERFCDKCFSNTIEVRATNGIDKTTAVKLDKKSTITRENHV